MIDLLVNFGGPRHLDEIAPFLTALLTDRDVIRTRFPGFFQTWLFAQIAKKRAVKIRGDYEKIGGKSPIYFDTEIVAEKLGAMTFHRYLPATHKQSLQQIEACPLPLIRVLPLFPQFSYVTTGSIARFFRKNLSPRTLNKLRWIHSYAAHPAFIASYQRRIRNFLQQRQIQEEECILLFSAHGIPRSFIESGDIYESECRHSFEAVREAFPKATCRLSYQSKFGRGEWIRPYTDESCEAVLSWGEGRRQIVIVPISFTSDHIETLFEIEELYLPILRNKGLAAHRCPALNLETDWIAALREIAATSPLSATQMLIR
ncbi:MAG TPA: ferrochelatase [Chlamydiales bacterium]|jgi:ferrochelatase|nr:ferrochelatase [Chlamydiales bacterium]